MNLSDIYFIITIITRSYHFTGALEIIQTEHFEMAFVVLSGLPPMLEETNE